MAKTGFTLDLKYTKDVDLSNIAKMNGKFVKFGFLNDKVKLYPDGTSTIEVALKNEFGGVFDTKSWKQQMLDRGKSKELVDKIPQFWTIPARPFFRTAWEKNNKKYSKFIEDFLKKVMNSDPGELSDDTVEYFLEKLGAIAVQDVKKSMLEGEWQENASLTIALKESDQPLVDTGVLIDSVSYDVLTGDKPKDG